MKKVINAILLCCTIIACNDNKSFEPNKYVQYLKNAKNEYQIKQTIGIHEYTIQLATPEYMIVKELGNDDDSTTANFQKRMKELKGYLFFLIKMNTTEKSRMEQGGKRTSEQQLNVDRMVSYYDQQAILDISLTQGYNELKPVTYVFENNYELSPFNTIVVGFEVGENKEDLTLTFNDKYNNIPAIRASFSKKKLESLPKLNINN